MEIIATHGNIMIALAVVFGLYMTWGIGANDLANAMGTSVGAGAIKLRTGSSEPVMRTNSETAPS